jgi:hypothetical protein
MVHAPALSGRCDPHREAAEQQACSGEYGNSAEGASERVRIVAHVERVPSPPQHDCGGEAACGGLDVEALQQVEHGQPDEERQCKAQRALPAAPEVRRGHEQEDRAGDDRGVRELQRFERLDVEEQVVAPGDVGLDCGSEVDEARERGGHGREPGKGVGAPDRLQRLGAYVEAEPPGGGVAARREEIAPILRHEPDSRHHAAATVVRPSSTR